MINLPLKSYQETASKFIQEHPKCGLFLNMGLGKTLSVLDALTHLNLQYSVLVIAPLNIAKNTWSAEVEKWNIPIKVQSLVVNERGKKLSKKKREQLYLDPFKGVSKLYLINRELVPAMVEFYQSRHLPFPFVMLIIDESQSFKNPQSKRFKALKKIAWQIKRVVLLSGTPAPNGMMDLWSQMFLLDQGQRLGRSIKLYQRDFFTEGGSVYIPGYGHVVTSYDLKEDCEDEIFKRISDITMSTKTNLLKLPDRIINDIVLNLGPDFQTLYDDFKEELVMSIFNDINDSDDPNHDAEMWITAANQAVLTGKLTQLASGTLYFDDDIVPASDAFAGTIVPGGKIESTFQACRPYSVWHTEKLDMLESILDSESSPVMVAYRYRSDLNQIVNRFTKNKRAFKVFDGNERTLADWNAGYIPVLLIQPASAGHGLNFQDGGHVLVWYTLPWSMEEYEQTNARLHRMGQDKPVIIHRLMSANTIDEHISEVLAGKATIQKALLDFIRIETPNTLPKGD